MSRFRSLQISSQYNRKKTNSNFIQIILKSFTELKNEVAELFHYSKATTKILQHDIVGQCIIEAFENIRLEMSSTDVYLKL